MNRSLVGLIVALLVLRACLDGFYPDQKPGALIAAYVGTLVLISVALLSRGTGGARSVYIVLPLISFVALSASLLWSDVSLYAHAGFILQVFSPMLFLLACAARPRVAESAANFFVKRVAVWLILLLVIMVWVLYLRAEVGGSVFEYYANAPNHVLAQTLLKLSIPYAAGSYIWGGLLLAVFVLINVRSVLLSFVIAHGLSLAGRMRASVLRYVIVLLPLAFLCLLYVAHHLFDAGFVDRLLYRGRGDWLEDGISNISSGRTDLYLAYMRLVIEDFSLLEILLGRGPIWLEGGTQDLSAHNDALNLLVSCGLVGLLLVCAAYYQFVSVLPPGARRLAIALLVILFLTNGVVFHQSNVLFVLFFALRYGLGHGAQPRISKHTSNYRCSSGSG